MPNGLSERLAKRNPYLSINRFVGLYNYCKLKQENSSLSNGHDNCDQVTGLRPHFGKERSHISERVIWFFPFQPKKCVNCPTFKKSEELKKPQN